MLVLIKIVALTYRHNLKKQNLNSAVIQGKLFQ